MQISLLTIGIDLILASRIVLAVNIIIEFWILALGELQMRGNKKLHMKHILIADNRL